jgi:hypothetical protein
MATRGAGLTYLRIITGEGSLLADISTSEAKMLSPRRPLLHKADMGYRRSNVCS